MALDLQKEIDSLKDDPEYLQEMIELLKGELLAYQKSNSKLEDENLLLKSILKEGDKFSDMLAGILRYSGDMKDLRQLERWRKSFDRIYIKERLLFHPAFLQEDKEKIIGFNDLRFLLGMGAGYEIVFNIVWNGGTGVLSKVNPVHIDKRNWCLAYEEVYDIPSWVK